MNERDISKDIIESIINNDVPIIIIPSKQDPEIDLVLAQVHDRFYMLALNRHTGILVTVRPMRTTEKKFYREKLQ